MEYYLLINEEKTGPYTITQLRSMWNAVEVNADTLWWREGFKEWKPLRAMISELESRPAKSIVPQQTPPNRVVLSDIDIPFTRMVAFMVKWAFAAIPAAVIIWMALLVITLIVGLLFGGVGRLFGR